MKPSEYIRTLQLIELEILKDIDRICRDNDITYYLGEGTLLGAVRHQGFIPWDDDIDIMMPRDDYDRFLGLDISSSFSQYEIQHSSLQGNYFSPILKFRLKDNSFYGQSHISHVTQNNGPLVDIFPLDNVPKLTSRKQRMQSNRIRALRGMLTIKMGLGKADTFQKRILKLGAPFFSVKKIHRLLDKYFKMYNDPQNEYYVSLGSYYPCTKQTFPKKWFGKPVYAEFEDLKFPVPAKFHEVLQSIYGDYMKLPSESERKIKHHF